LPSSSIVLQHLLPHHLLSRVILGATRVTVSPIKNALIGAVARSYARDLTMVDAVEPDAFAYRSFNAFFTRALKPQARPLAGDSATLISPVDGTISQMGAIQGDQIFQAKGHSYSTQALLAGAAPTWSPRFRGGQFATLYLAPYNYHRIHMPADGKLLEAWYVPGRLFSVNTKAVEEIPGLFARNERVVLLFEGSSGIFAVIFVGALLVGSMATVWHGDVAPRWRRKVTQLELPSDANRQIRRGAEVGRFNMGSTVIVLFGPDQVALSRSLQPGMRIRMGSALGQFNAGSTRV
jgi:phosphatidylserine decarboxylase